MRKVYSAATLPDAYLVRELLAREGIDARVFNENAQSLMGEIPVNLAWPEVWVMHDDDLAVARNIVRVLEYPSVGGPPIFCPHCREENPHGFQLCWSCGGDF